MVENIFLHLSQYKLLLAPLQGLENIDLHSIRVQNKLLFYKNCIFLGVNGSGEGKLRKEAKIHLQKRDKIINIKIRLPNSRRLCQFFSTGKYRLDFYFIPGCLPLFTRCTS